MTLSDIATHRLINQHIRESSFTKPADMVAWLGAVQAQEYGLSKWAIGLRMPHLTDADIEQEFTDGKILRTHLLRPTWHFVTPADIRWLLQLTAPRVKAVNAFMYRKMELNADIFRRSHDTLVKALEGGKQLTRTQLNTELTKQGIIADGIRLSCLMMEAELDGIICSGARQGKQFTYALLDERVPPAKALHRDDALAELTKRYFSSRGPATVNDFSTWSGLPISDAKKGLDLVKSLFLQEVINNEMYHFPPANVVNADVPLTRLLPIYDEYIMGYKNRSAVLKFRALASPASNFVFDQTIIVDGQIVGTWHRVVNAKNIDLELSLFKKLNELEQSALTDSINHFSRFMNLPVAVVDR
ncbi:winged helix DNA-binding domain-containing protein [Spirosoma endophyticum]|uniref:Winged helix DNA-binding domain-containing protein n=1 Tax=Spirosoma endophyticum TaxID=662367 RepID=A0A1I1SEU6_9BACT|nr:winged helix DNA-binding domain-containing protein [Spirosoma endophyticum]SFD45015.1 Winged helix DNA-binding domain-containing protein [Spirosoma endophyticum]